jgi:hypothetical protein
MTPRDHYLCAAVQLVSSNGAQEIIAAAAVQAGVSGPQMLATTATVFAEAMAEVACARWGHLWSEDYKNVYGGEPARRIGERRECHRCGHAQTRTLTEVMPPASSTMMPYDEPGEWQDEEELAAEQDQDREGDDMAVRCTCCKGWIASRVPCFGYQPDGLGGFFVLKNCPACHSTVGVEPPAMVVGVRGIEPQLTRPRQVAAGAERRAA